MGTTILFLWAVIATTSGGSHQYYDWRALAEFSSPAACERAIAQLSVKKDRARCVAK